MKKLLAIVLALCVGCMLLPAVAEEADFLGEWFLIKLVMGETEIDPSMMGLSISMTFNEGGTGTAATIQGGEEETHEFTWEQRDGQLVMISDGEEGPITLEDGLMKIASPSGDMILSREAPASAVAAEPVAAESEETFLGTWSATRVNMEGTMISLDMVAAMGLNLEAKLTIEAGKVTVSFAFMSDEPVVYEGESAFADGVLQMTMPEGQEPVVIQLLDSGELLCTLTDSTTGTALPLYFAPAEE